MNNEEHWNVLLERLDRINDELGRVRRSVQAAMSGTPFNEVFDEELYQEGADRRDRAITFLGRMMEHLLKLAYCDSKVGFDNNKDGWIKAVERHRENAATEMDWGGRSNKGIQRLVESRIHESYEAGFNHYRTSIRKDNREDLIGGLVLIPKECPWTLLDLMTCSIKSLMDMLSDTSNTV
jgi:hypothetical protein